MTHYNVVVGRYKCDKCGIRYKCMTVQNVATPEDWWYQTRACPNAKLAN